MIIIVILFYIYLYKLFMNLKGHSLFLVSLNEKIGMNKIFNGFGKG